MSERSELTPCNNYCYYFVCFMLSLAILLVSYKLYKEEITQFSQAAIIIHYSVAVYNDSSKSIIIILYS